LSIKISRRDLILGSSSLLLSGCVGSGIDLTKLKLAKQKKKLVVLFMSGGASQFELFDYKEELYKSDGKKVSGFEAETGQRSGKILKPFVNFKKTGESGAWVSDLMPETAKVIDELCFVRSVSTTTNNHELAQLEFHTGNTITGHPSISYWVSELFKPAHGVPSSVIMSDSDGSLLRIGELAWGRGSLEQKSHQLVFSSPEQLRSSYNNLMFDKKVRNDKIIEYLKSMNQFSKTYDFNQVGEHLEFLLASKNKMLETSNLENLTTHERNLYGLNDADTKDFGMKLLIARRLLEQGVCFIEVFSGGEMKPNTWDFHEDILQIKSMSKKIDRPIYGFITDLLNRGMLDDTIILWAGEFGRLPVVDADVFPRVTTIGRGHNERANTIWIAGGGFKKGFSYGQTDELGLNVVKDKLEFGDIWSTILFQMGLEPSALKLDENNRHLMKSLIKSKHRIIHEIIS
jgi:hypothetical protein